MAKTKFRPLHDRVIVKRVEAEKKSKGGIIIPDTAKENPQQGEGVAVGPGGRDESGKLIRMDLKAGDRVLFGKWSGTEVKLDGEELLIMKESDIMGILEGRTSKPAKKAACRFVRIGNLKSERGRSQRSSRYRFPASDFRLPQNGVLQWQPKT